MERDPNISKLIRESGLGHAPDSFSKKVMKRIVVEPEKKAYRPLISRFGRILIVLFIAGIIVISLIYSEPGGRILESFKGISNLEWQLPQPNLSLDFLSEINISAWLAFTFAAIFILVFTDASLSRRKRLI